MLVLLYYFPPMGGSGVQRPLKFLKYLPEFGWQPIVVCPDFPDFLQIDADLAAQDWFSSMKIYRVQEQSAYAKAAKTGLLNLPETAKKFLRWITAWWMMPDNKKKWQETALLGARKALKEHPDISLIFSSGPPFSNLLAASRLAKEYQLPYIADYRDAWVDGHLSLFPTPWHRKKHLDLQQKALAHAQGVVAINEAILKTARLKNHQKGVVITQGFDQDDFDRAKNLAPDARLQDRHWRYFIHSGLFYNERRVDELFLAFSRFIKQHPTYRLKLVLQGGLRTTDKAKAMELGIQDLVIDLGYQPHLQAIRNALQCDALILLIGHRKKPEQIATGKLYEYMGLSKPIVAMVPETGYAAEQLKSYGAVHFADPYDTESAYQAFKCCYEQLMYGDVPIVDKSWLHLFDRKFLTGKLAELYDQESINPRS